MILVLLLTIIFYLLILPPIISPLNLTMLMILFLFVLLLELGLVEDCSIISFDAVINGIASFILLITLIVCFFGSTSMFHAQDFHNAISITNNDESSLSENIPNIDMINSISLMDTDSAKKLGDRTMGSITELVSQYTVGDYYTICVNGEVKKIAPLAYNGFFKWTKNDNIPGYVIVDPITNEAEYVELDNRIKYSPSAYFGDDLLRHIRLSYPKKFLSDYSFQIDDEGKAYWVIPTLKCLNMVGNRVPDGAIIMNADTGVMTWYKIDEIPEWVDIVFSGDMVSTLYNRYGRYINGFINFSNTGVTQVTEDFGYIAMNDDIYIYTGITSVSNDESNLGFILVNSRTGEFNYYPIAGAEEYSAMGAAEGIVQNYGYKASFPSLVMIENTPTYVMVLKDANGLVKQYAMVNYKNYTIAVVADNIDDCKYNYLKAINPENPIDSLKEGYGLIKKIEFIIMDGETYCYIVTTDDIIYYNKFEENQLLLDIGDEFSISNFKKHK